MDTTGSVNGTHLIMEYYPCGKQSQEQALERFLDC